MRIDDRKALLWIKEHQPTPWSSLPGAPKRGVMTRLIKAHLVEFHRSKQRRLDPVTFVLSPSGKKALEHDQETPL